MKRNIYVIPSLVLALNAADASPKLTILVYNYAAIPSKALAQTEREAARIYQRSGIETEWLDCSLGAGAPTILSTCPTRPRQTDVILRIVPQSMREPLRQIDDSFGFAQFSEDGRMAVVCNVFSSAAEQIAKRNGIKPSAVLGNVIAHEIGHLLLGPGSHSPTGIMRARWDLFELQTIARGWMAFTPDESDRMQLSIRFRMSLARAGQ